MNLADPHPSNCWTALAAAATFGLHPANAETVNYIIQRADLYNTLGCVAGVWLFARYPAQRKHGWYLIPPALAMLSKAPALVFPLLLLAYVWLFEPGPEGERKWKFALRPVLPATALAAAAGYLLWRMQPETWSPGAESAALYRITQPFVALYYFKSFFLPAGLNVDPGWHYVSPWSWQALSGYLFVLVLAAMAGVASRTRRGKPVAFGIVWFFVALLPTSLTPLADVTNDHRMFFCFVGLALAVLWTSRLALFHWTRRLTRHRRWIYASVGAMAAILILAGSATRGRNRVWLTEESLWSDSVAKNPLNPRALSNYAASAFDQADYEKALHYWERAAAIDPASPQYQTFLVRASLKLNRGDLSERHLRQLAAMMPLNPGVYVDYAEWLISVGRFDEGLSLLERARQLDPNAANLKRVRMELFAHREAASRTLVFRALDTDGDGRLSAAEILAAPAALLSLDKNGDGELTAEECGARFTGESIRSPQAIERARREFMHASPILEALDANHDGKISAMEMREADRALAALDRDGDGTLKAARLVPEYVTAAARRVMAQIDRNRDGQIEPDEWPPAGPLRDLLTAADVQLDGVVTLEELTNEIFYRADRNRDGVVTQEELEAAIRSGVYGQVRDKAPSIAAILP
jgi:tetratricopeptide (TPR) repeat protein